MRLLVTGGAGFIGSHFVRAILGDRLPGLEGATVTVLDKLSYAASFDNLNDVVQHKRLDFVPADVCDAAAVETALRGHDAVVHLAADSTAFDPASSLGTQVLLDASVRLGVTRFLRVSTGAVYGSLADGAWTESSPVCPATPYAAGMAAGDLLALACHRTHGLPVVVTRAANTYGPAQHPEKLIPRVVTGVLTGVPVPLHGRGDDVREWVHAEDHCRALARVLLDGRPGEVYHVGGSVELPTRDLVRQLLAACGAGWDRVTEVPPRPGAGRRRALDDAKLRTELGWRPGIEFDQGLTATVRWYRDNPGWWRPLMPD